MENKETEIDLVALIKSVWAKRKKIAIWGAIGACIGVIIAMSIPKEYDTSIEFVLENNQKSNNSSMGALGGMIGINLNGSDKGGVTEQIYPKIFESTPFLTDFAKIPVVYKEQLMPFCQYMLDHQKRAWWSYILSAPGAFTGWVSNLGEEKIAIDSLNNPELIRNFAGTLKGKVKLVDDGKTSVYKLTASLQDAKISKQVADSAMVFLSKYITKYKTAKSQSNLNNSIIALSIAKQTYYHADSCYAAVADRNQNLTSNSAKLRIERLQNEKDLAFSIYQQLATQVEMDRIKLNEDMPIATIIEPSFEATGAAKPNRKLIILAFLILGVVSCAGSVIVKELLKKPTE